MKRLEFPMCYLRLDTTDIGYNVELRWYRPKPGMELSVLIPDCTLMMQRQSWIRTVKRHGIDFPVPILDCSLPI